MDHYFNYFMSLSVEMALSCSNLILLIVIFYVMASARVSYIHTSCYIHGLWHWVYVNSIVVLPQARRLLWVVVIIDRLWKQTDWPRPGSYANKRAGIKSGPLYRLELNRVHEAIFSR